MKNILKLMALLLILSPLLPEHFIKLPVGKIKPQGWLLQYLELQRNGLTGQLGEISAWLDKDNNAWLNDGVEAEWEEVPYWLKGYGSIAYILEDPKMLAETQTWIEAALKSQQPDGYFGPINDRGGKRVDSGSPSLSAKRPSFK